MARQTKNLLLPVAVFGTDVHVAPVKPGEKASNLSAQVLRVLYKSVRKLHSVPLSIFTAILFIKIKHS
jgi:hypothetical protein